MKVHMLLAVLFALAAALVAQEKCQEFRALTPLWFDAPLGGYIGPAFAMLGDEVLFDAGAPRPPVRPPMTSCEGGTCTERMAEYLYDFGGGDSITLQVQIATHGEPPSYSTYRAINKMVAGTGRFKSATGMLVESGPFLAWVDAKGMLQSRYNGEITGKICNVAPKAKK